MGDIREICIHRVVFPQLAKESDAVYERKRLPGWTGDLAFHQRLLPVFEHTDTAGWLETWGVLEALGAEIVIPGHGDPTNMTEVTRYTRDYLTYMRGSIGEIIEEGGDLNQAYEVDQSAYRHLDTFEELFRRNAGQIFRHMEFE